MSMIGKEAERMWNMGSKALILIFAWMICLLISNSPLVAQSRDRNNPTPLQTPTISGIASPFGTVNWYKLAAGPGELVIEMWIGSGGAPSYYAEGSARFVLYDKDWQEVMNEFISAGFVKAEERKYKSLQLQSNQDFFLSIELGEGRNPGGTSRGTYMIRFKGVIDLAPEKEER